ncbi:sorting nexin-29 isoform X1 [Pezoporus flaviventris]|uniref:sorting nexin-29 isoform X1 n=2 Tax=Pezoporus flaviventris TaxID=889875 RepID=UPI002AB07AB0|nr:sorting nexin-29 isoform X1 [Pezoporus flaviventris]
MSGSQNNDTKRQFLLERLLDAVKQCQIRFGGRKEIASDSDSRVTCLCAQFEAVFQHGLRRSRGLALTAAAIKQAAGFSSKTETEPVFWYYVKEVLNKHELQRFCSLKTITTDIGRGRAWLRCALNEHSLERYVHMLLADKNRLGVFYEDWSFMMDEERSSMIPTMAAGLNSILFAINIDNKDLNGQSKCTPTVSDLLKESTQNVTSLLKESTQGVSSLLREITASSAVSILIKPDQDTDPLPVLSKSVNADLKCKKDRKKKKRVTHIISFDEEEDDHNLGDTTKTLITESSEESVDRPSVFASPSSESILGKSLNGSETNHSWKSNSVFLNGEYEYQKLDVKSIDDEDADEYELYGKSLGNKDTEGETEASEKPHELGTCNSQICSCSPLQVLNDDSDVLFPVSAVGSYSQTDNLENGEGHEHVHTVELVPRRSDLPYRVEVSPPAQVNTFSNMLPSATVPESMTINELRQAIVAMMNRKDELEEQNRSLRNLLDGEMEHSAALRQEMDNWRRKAAEQEERHAMKVQALARENEVLKVQLKKYVGAVQMLRREGQTVEVPPGIWSTDGEFPMPEHKQVENNEELASSYERKLIEVAEMHGELIEFNERLHRALMAKEALVSQMRQELIDLRGPVPGDLSQTSEDQSLSDFEISNRALINVWIPSVFLRGKAANAFHVYQVYIRIKDDEWNVYRRYAEFRSLHHKLQNKYQQVRTFNFPPKKAIGNKDAKFVEERRKQLQNYLRNVMNKIIQTVPEFTANPKKETLIQLMPFFMPQLHVTTVSSDIATSGESGSKSNRSRVTTRFPKLSRSHQREPRSLEPQSGDL